MAWNSILTKAKVWASGPITLWQTEGRKVETVTGFFLLGSKIPADSDCCQEIKRHLSLGRKAVTNLDSVLKSRDITWPTKVHIVKALVFPVVMYRCESWIIKKAECQRIDAFELWCWGTLESPLDFKEVRPGWLDSVTDSMNVNLSKLQERVEDRGPGVLQSVRLQRVRHDLETEQQQQISPCSLISFTSCILKHRY